MNTFRKYLLLLILIAGTAVSNGQNKNNFEISKNLDVFATLFKELNTNYVDEIRAGELMNVGIDAMLEHLDPYTVFIPESEVEDYKFMTTGQYGGIGAIIHKQDEYVVISEPYEGKPAHQAGLLAGDRIIEVDGKSVVGRNTSDVSAILKGQPGTSVNVTVERDGETFTREITREYVKIENIPYHSVMEGNIGYIKLSGFTQNAGNEVKQALNELKQEQELEGVILDLRSNGGGLLHEAVNTTNIFVDKGQLVVSTRGKLPTKNKSYKTPEAPVDTEIPLVVLVDTASASASEIVAGAVQDLDRGVVLGQRTFGKGLVQNVIPLSYNSQAKITVAKYYIPSGRCIQAIDYSHKDYNGQSEKTPDSLYTAFKTLNGRTVYDKGGIEPDIVVKPRRLHEISIALMSNHLIFDFTTEFVKQNPEIEAPGSFEVTPAIWNDFLNYISGKDYKYTTSTEEALTELKAAAKEDRIDDPLADQITMLENEIASLKSRDLEKYEEEIKMLLKFEIISRYYFQKGKIIASLDDDPELEKALEILNDHSRYLAIIGNGPSGSGEQKTDQ